LTTNTDRTVSGRRHGKLAERKAGFDLTARINCHFTEDQNISIKLTKQQIEDSPSLLSDLPVSKQLKMLITGTTDGQFILTVHTNGVVIPLVQSVGELRFLP